MKVLLGLVVFLSALFAVDLQPCVKTSVSKKSVIFSCTHGEYYVEYGSSSKRDVESLRVLFTSEEKYRYLNRKLDKEEDKD